LDKDRPWYQWYKEQKPIHFPEVSLYTFLEQTVNRYREKTAIIFEDEEITYGELKRRVDQLAAAWKEMGFEKGERIGLMLANHPHYIVSYYAAQALGLIVVQINPHYTTRELLQIIHDSQVSYIIVDPISLKTLKEVKNVYSFKTIMLSQTEVDEKENEYIKLETLINFPKQLEKYTDVNAKEDVAVIQYTGGTTGKMKGAMLTHYNLTSNVIQSYWMYGEKMIFGEEMILTATPLYHVYAMTSAMNLGIYIGAKILLFRKFEVNDVLEKIQKYQPTFFPGVPKMYNAFVNHPEIEKYHLKCLKFCSSGSAPLPVEVIRRFEQLTGAKIGEGFGMSETSPSTHRNPPFGKRKVGSVGIPFPDTDCKIVDENNQELGPKMVGELVIKGPQVMKGYWNNELETMKAIQNGWLYTGDLAMMDEEGYFYIVGRKKEMIIVGGFNIYPQEIEGVLYEHPDVKEAAVVGIPYAQEEIVKAYIVPKNNDEIDIEKLRRYCYTKLTKYKVPREFEIRESLPRNTVGKLLKRLLVEEELEKEMVKNENIYDKLNFPT
jgi:long-chain acyl-CoA synthetase